MRYAPNWSRTSRQPAQYHGYKLSPYWSDLWECTYAVNALFDVGALFQDATTGAQVPAVIRGIGASCNTKSERTSMCGVRALHSVPCPTPRMSMFE